jgi:hypothetical protein
MKEILLCTVLLMVACVQAFAEEVPDKVKEIASSLMEYGKNPVIISAVQKQNSRGLSLTEIQLRDKKWKGTDGVDDFMKSHLENEAAKTLLDIEQSQPYFLEVFLMDDQGANVAMTNKTGDYWQGDEAKWKESYKEGNGALHIGPVEFDESAQAYLVQVSVPVMDGSKAIGAITIGINLDEIEQP